MAAADFNRDGYADLAVADLSEKAGDKASAGAVTLVWGSQSGLTGTGAIRLKITASSHRGFGKQIEAGDFNGDGKTDLAVADGIEAVRIYRGGFSKTGTTGSVTKHVPNALLEPAGLVAGKVTKDSATDDGDKDVLVSSDYYSPAVLLPGTGSAITGTGAQELGIVAAFPT
ncbi:VCBS repeat-containing protein [Streptomyces sp. P17]|uniref:FG-GAP repeat domain-containing protein n=1 Tax=Streptomyces sp. P17 TaxID=3074716 RepID=UPI0028F406E0|nr:VCBS repeat-containing protein [Streptomyces sp. P17]MDT9699350.1 VCBS repeat-containing protein [Streptomyces sp. P17]